jgi:hypothetical protein
MTLPRKFVAKTPEKKLTKKSMTKTRKILFLSSNFRYSNSHFCHLEIFQQRIFM